MIIPRFKSKSAPASSISITPALPTLLLNVDYTTNSQNYFFQSALFMMASKYWKYQQNCLNNSRRLNLAKAKLDKNKFYFGNGNSIMLFIFFQNVQTYKFVLFLTTKCSYRKFMSILFEFFRIFIFFWFITFKWTLRLFYKTFARSGLSQNRLWRKYARRFNKFLWMSQT